MIRVVKPDRPPKILRDKDARGLKATKKLKDAYDDGRRDFEFKSDIYGAKSVKAALIKAQHKKCCFCESKVTHISYGDVEHFRPKGGFRQKKSDPLTRPGYYWLAYEWSNLFLSCTLCNQRYKANLFPLAVTRNRARSHEDDVSAERPLFIHPSDDDPEQYIGFRDEIVYAIDGKRRGKVTIEGLRLDRNDLEEMRRDRLQPAKRSKRIVRYFRQLRDRQGGLPAEVESLLEEHEAAIAAYLDPVVEYSSMLKAALS